MNISVNILKNIHNRIVCTELKSGIKIHQNPKTFEAIC
jgi:hypothetical protein